MSEPCTQEKRISTLEADGANICRSVDDLRDTVKENTRAINTLNISITNTKHEVSGINKTQTRQIDWGDRILLAFIGISSSIVTALLVAYLLRRP